jgi:hypothetical protein
MGMWWGDLMTSLREHAERGAGGRAGKGGVMTRKVVGCVLGLVAWFVVATVLDRTLRAAWPAYAAVWKVFAFSLSMLVARLVVGAASTVAAGSTVAWIAQRHFPSAVATGLLLLAFFVPTHATIWDRFPVWYHLLFLGSLLPLTVFGAQLVGARAES